MRGLAISGGRLHSGWRARHRVGGKRKGCVRQRVGDLATSDVYWRLHSGWSTSGGRLSHIGWEAALRVACQAQGGRSAKGVCEAKGGR